MQHTCRAEGVAYRRSHRSDMVLAVAIVGWRKGYEGLAKALNCCLSCRWINQVDSWNLYRGRKSDTKEQLEGCYWYCNTVYVSERKVVHFIMPVVGCTLAVEKETQRVRSTEGRQKSGGKRGVQSGSNDPKASALQWQRHFIKTHSSWRLQAEIRCTYSTLDRLLTTLLETSPCTLIHYN